MGIKSIKIQNYKSIRDSGEIEIKPLNVLIGPNGAGKSNFINFFEFLNKLYEQQLQLYISKNGRADNFLYFGRKVSEYLSGIITFDNDLRNQYQFKLLPDQSGNLIFAEEWSNIHNPLSKKLLNLIINLPGGLESILKDKNSNRNMYLCNHFDKMKVFHFQDNCFNSKMRQPAATNDYAYLYEDGGNIASFLYRLHEGNERQFRMIERIIKSIAPFFDRFYLKPDEINPQQIYLRWLEKGSDQIFNAHNFSDGTLRMICLTTLLMQHELPNTIIIDEPELGLHPFAINKLAAMIQSASTSSQIIVSTQSVNFVNEFKPEDVIIVDRADNQSVFKRLSSEDLKEWLNDYSLGELWEKNLLGGRP